jgi:carboxylesterase
MSGDSEGARVMTTRDQSYRLAGGPTGVLLLHGLCGTPAELRYVANALARQGYTVHCPMLAGHGGSQSLLEASSWTDWYESAERALDELRESCDTVIVGGLSTGAILALLLAARRPADVQGVKLYSPTLWLDGWRVPWYARAFRLVTQKWLARLISFPAPHQFGIKDQRIREFVQGAMAAGDKNAPPPLTRMSGAVVLERRWLVDVARRLLGDVTQPVLIIHPREDDFAGLSNVAYLQRRLPGAVETVILDDSWHIVTVDRQRQAVAERSAEFVARMIGGPATRSATPAADLRVVSGGRATGRG